MNINTTYQKAWKLFWAFFVLCTIHSVAQQVETADTVSANEIARIRKLIDKEEYAKAQDAFVQLFKSEATLPNDLVFLYGKTLFKLGKAAQSKSVLSKYVELEGPKGKYYTEAVKYLQSLGDKICLKCNNKGFIIDTVTCSACVGRGYKELLCTRCQGSGMELCPVCKGSKVVVAGTSFGAKFTPCSLCAMEGYVVCKSCNGESRIKEVCNVCNGQKRLAKKFVCNAH